MKVIDKRTEKNDDWHVGDVVCYYDNFSDDGDYSEDLPINYCPMCGRKLTHD